MSPIAYGGDWNPEQWPRETWHEDVALMREAGVTRVSAGIFAWSKLEPVEGRFEFGWFDEALGLLAEAGIEAGIATPTAAPPPWFGHRYPQALPVDRDGRTLFPGSRQAFCPSSPIYREKALRIVEEIGQRYGDHPALVQWHVHNEYGCHNARCFCDHSAEAFRAWLCERYQKIENLNEAWGTAFWSQSYGDWEQILPPRAMPYVANPAHELDYRRFSSAALLDLYRTERDLLRRLAPSVPATTNLMAGTHWDMDCWAFADEVDAVANDHYLPRTDEAPHRPYIDLAFAADLSRSLAGGKPWQLMEHSTSAVSWQGRNRAKEPGELRRNALANLARGADAIMFFQWRASASGAEKWHSAMLPHAGTRSKIWREVVALGRELDGLGDLAGEGVGADVAILLDYEAVWALDDPAQPAEDLDPVAELKAWHAALWLNGVVCDFARPEGDLSGYRVVLVPSLYLVSDAGAENLTRFVRDGGTVLVGPYSGIADQHDRVRLGGYPGAWRDLLGVRVEEFFPLSGPQPLESGATGRIWSELAEPVTAKVADTYLGGPLCGAPARTRNEHGQGVAHYLTTCLSGDDLKRVLAAVCREAGVAPTADVPEGLEAVRRGEHLFLINHTDSDLAAAGVTVPAGDVRILTGHVTTPTEGARRT